MLVSNDIIGTVEAPVQGAAYAYLPSAKVPTHHDAREPFGTTVGSERNPLTCFALSTLHQVNFFRSLAMNRGQTTVCPMLLSDRIQSRKPSSEVSFPRMSDDVQPWKEVRSNEPEKKTCFYNIL